MKIIVDSLTKYIYIYINKSLKFIKILFLSSILGFLFLFIAYLFPIDRITNNVLETSKYYWSIPDYQKIIYNYDFTTIGNQTDQLMLLESVYNEGKILDRVILNYHYNALNKGYDHSLYYLQELINGFETNNNTPYGRYWHGYLIILKPLLMFLNHNEILILNSVIQPSLFLVTIFLMLKNNMNKYIVPFVLSLLFIFPISIALTMQFSIVYYILFVAIILLLKMPAKIIKYSSEYFYIIGILTAYFDYLTWPLVTLMIPLIFIIILNNKDLKYNLLYIIKNTLLYGIGYIMMWINKFILSYFFYGDLVLKDGVNQFLYRTQNEIIDGYSTRIVALKNNLLMFDNNAFKLILLFFILYIVYKLIFNYKKIKFNLFLNNIHFLLIALSPIVWILLTANHSYVHYWMVYRIFMISLFSLGVYFVNVLSFDK